MFSFHKLTAKFLTRQTAPPPGGFLYFFLGLLSTCGRKMVKKGFVRFEKRLYTGNAGGKKDV